MFIYFPGWSLAEHQEWSKFSNYEVATRVPLIFADLARYKHVKKVKRDSFHVEDDTRKRRLKLYRRIDQKLWKNFDNWKGHATRDNYEQYWNLSGYFGTTEEGANSHYLMSKHEQHNVPGSVQKPTRMKSNVTYDGIVELVDLFPTLADLAGIERVPICYLKGTKNWSKKDGAILCTEGTSLSPIIIEEKTKYEVNDTARSNYNFNGSRICLHEGHHHHQCHTTEYDPTLWSVIAKYYFLLVSLVKVTLFKYFQSSSPNTLLTSPPNTLLTSPPKTLLTSPPNSHTQIGLSAEDCLSALQYGRVAMSQYPRPSTTPSIHPDSDQPRLTETVAMGYSLRSLCYRYTSWVAFNATTFKPDFSTVYGSELYDHRWDPNY